MSARRVTCRHCRQLHDRVPPGDVCTNVTELHWCDNCTRYCLDLVGHDCKRRPALKPEAVAV